MNHYTWVHLSLASSHSSNIYKKQNLKPMPLHSTYNKDYSVQIPAIWKEENHITISSVNGSALQRDPSSFPIEKRQRGHVLWRPLSHLSTQSLWNLCKQGRTLVSSFSLSLDKHTQHHPTSILPIKLGISASAEDEDEDSVWDGFCLILCGARPIRLNTIETKPLRVIWFNEWYTIKHITYLY